MANEQFSIRIQKYNPKEIEDKAVTYLMNRNLFINAAVDILMDMSPEVYKNMVDFADKLKLPVGLVMQNIMIDRIAQDDAEEKVYGPEYRKFLLEFIQTNQGPVTGEELYKILYGNYLKKFTSEYSEIIRKKEAAGAKLDQFIFIRDGDTQRIMTGDELLQTLKKKYITELKMSRNTISKILNGE